MKQQTASTGLPFFFPFGFHPGYQPIDWLGLPLSTLRTMLNPFNYQTPLIPLTHPRAVMVALLENECSNCNPKLTYVLQNSNTTIKSEYWRFSLENKKTYAFPSFTKFHCFIVYNKTAFNDKNSFLLNGKSLHLEWFCTINVIFVVVCILICQSLIEASWLSCWLIGFCVPTEACMPEICHHWSRTDNLQKALPMSTRGFGKTFR